MVTCDNLKLLLLASLLAVGCAAGRKAHLPSRLQFESLSDLKWTYPLYFAAHPARPDGLLCGLGPTTTELVSYATTDLGQHWSTPQTATSGASSVLLHTSQRAVMVGASEALSATLSEDGGATWKPGGSTPMVETVARVAYIAPGAADAGNQTLAVVGTSETLKYPLHISVDQGENWKTVQLSVPAPQGYKNFTVTPPLWSDGPNLVVDNQERIHWLFPEYKLTTSDGKMNKGTLYFRTVDGETMEYAQFRPVESSQYFEDDLGENHSRPDVLYQAIGRQQKSNETKHDSIPFLVEFSMSENGGKSWSSPFQLDDHKGAKMFLQVDGDNDLVVISWRDERSTNPGLYCVSSLDGGATWSEAERLGEFLPSRYHLAVRGQQVLLVGTVDSRPPSPFAILGKTKN